MLLKVSIFCIMKQNYKVCFKFTLPLKGFLAHLRKRIEFKKPLCYQSEGLFYSGLFTKLDLLYKTKTACFTNRTKTKVKVG